MINIVEEIEACSTWYTGPELLKKLQAFKDLEQIKITTEYVQTSQYEEGDWNIRIYRLRPETEEEAKAREKQNEKRKLADEGYEIAQLKLLMNKYPEHCGRG